MTLLNTTRLARATVAWCGLFAVIHFYWAAGGTAGMGGEPAETTGRRPTSRSSRSSDSSARASPPASSATPAAPPFCVARAGGAALLLGVVVGTGRWVIDGSLNGDGASGVATTLYFLLGGVLFLRLALPSQSRTKHARVRAGHP